MAVQSPTKPGRLSEVARHLVLPSNLTSTAFPSIDRRCQAMGIQFDTWQADLVRGALGKRKDGKYAATVGGVVWSLPRQVGKTFTVGAMLFALCIENPGLLVLWTAHHTRTSGETFRSMQGMARRSKVAPHVAKVYTGSGTESVVFENGSRILFGARDQGFGLGFAAVDVIVFDEAQRLRDQTRMDMVPAANRAHNPAGALLFYIGTPPRPTDEGEAFTQLRSEALSGDTDTFFVELSADPDADPDDREQWAKANPSYPHHTPVESMLRMRKHLGTDEAWLREALGIWHAAGSKAVIPAQMWADAADSVSLAVDQFALGIEVAPDAERASVALAGVRDDGAWHIELDESREGTAWLVPYVKAILEANPQIRGVGVDAGSPSKVLLDEFAAAGIRVITPKVQDLGAACTALLSGVVTGELKHIDQGQLNTSVSVASKRRLGDTGMWVWSRSTSAADVTPIQAATLALWVAQLDRIWKPALASSSDDGSVTIL